MASPDDVKRLAALARLDISDAELEKFSKEFESILKYIGQIDQLAVSTQSKATPAVRNVFRADGEPHEGGIFTEALAAQFPKRSGDSLSVKQIISHD